MQVLAALFISQNQKPSTKLRGDVVLAYWLIFLFEAGSLPSISVLVPSLVFTVSQAPLEPALP